jgi:plasmid maintenance system antidote protein VapI
VTSSRTPLVVIHPSAIIQEELDARGWSRDRLAVKMGGDAGLNRLALDMYFEVGPSHTDLLLGDEEAAQLARAFGVSAELFLNLQRQWLEASGVATC